MMRILALHPVPYLLPFGGLCVASRAMFEELVALGHQVTVVTTPLPGDEVETNVTRHGVDVRVLPRDLDAFDVGRLTSALAAVVEETKPDVCVSSEDVVAARGRRPEYGLFTEVIAGILGPKKVVYACHSATALPFGPHSTSPNAARQAQFGELAAIVTVSRYLTEYLAGFVKTRTEVIPFPVYGKGPFRDVSSFDRRCAGMINPSTIKGSSIFVALARALPERSFATVPAWATTPALMDELRSLPNVRIDPPTRDRDELYGRFSVLLVPSLWIEAFGLIVIEAMLRGIPVIAADHGGLPEAKLGVPYVVPVHPFERINTAFERLVAPEQDIEPWREAVVRLFDDRHEYERISALGREASKRFVDTVSAEPFARLLRDL